MIDVDLVINSQVGDVAGTQHCKHNGCKFAMVVDRKRGTVTHFTVKPISQATYDALQTASNQAEKRAIMADSDSFNGEDGCGNNWLNECGLVP